MAQVRIVHTELILAGGTPRQPITTAVNGTFSESAPS